jgi:hypothetical protein
MEKKMQARTIRGAALGLAGYLLSAGSAALANETVVVTNAAPQAKAGLTNAFEVGLGFGYTQGFGNVGNNVRSLSDSGGAGTSAELDLGWRIDPNWLVGIYGTGAWLSRGEAPGNAHNNWSAGAGVQGNYHFLPGGSFDPWVGLGVGWRGYFINRPQGTDTLHGLDFARVQVGVDVPRQSNHVLEHPESERRRVHQRRADGAIRPVRQLKSDSWDGPRLESRGPFFIQRSLSLGPAFPSEAPKRSRNP